ncbi:DUF4124 domain-containing protein [Kineobactrum salinum]|uniref:DUF4124 domain-containing protein n=2 Tax=Kineobactrum salinum TaxID=2708301 RepID=A0A6C0U657_9GAMM|nr:DUF4124 domain-containing protein [Kineobactrum salinum]
MRVFCTGLQVVLLLLSVAASGQVTASEIYYRWLDTRGNPVHSDRPPPAGTDYEVISTGSGFKRVVPANEGVVPKEVEPRVGNEFEKTETTTVTIDKTKNPALCERARQNLETLDSTARIRVRDDQGDMRFLNEEEIEAERSKALAAVKAYCE